MHCWVGRVFKLAGNPGTGNFFYQFFRFVYGALHALEKRGVPSTADNDYKNHVSRLVTRADLAGARLVVAVTGFHATQLIMKFPEYATKITVMPEDVPDPYGGSDEEYETCLGQIEDALKRVFPPPAGKPDVR